MMFILTIHCLSMIVAGIACIIYSSSLISDDLAVINSYDYRDDGAYPDIFETWSPYYRYLTSFQLQSFGWRLFDQKRRQPNQEFYT